MPAEGWENLRTLGNYAGTKRGGLEGNTRATQCELKASVTERATYLLRGCTRHTHEHPRRGTRAQPPALCVSLERLCPTSRGNSQRNRAPAVVSESALRLFAQSATGGGCYEYLNYEQRPGWWRMPPVTTGPCVSEGAKGRALCQNDRPVCIITFARIGGGYLRARFGNKPSSKVRKPGVFFTILAWISHYFGKTSRIRVLEGWVPLTLGSAGVGEFLAI